MSPLGDIRGIRWVDGGDGGREMMASTSRDARASLFTRTAEFTPSELPLTDPEPTEAELPRAIGQASARIREALRRWLDEEL